MRKWFSIAACTLIASGCVAAEVATIDTTDSAVVEETPTPVEPEPSVELFQPIPPAIEVPVTWDTLVERSDEISKIVYDDVHATIERNKQIEGYNEIPYRFYRSPNLDDIHYAGIDSWLDDLFALYANTVQPDKETYIAFPYEDLEWAVEVLSDPEVNQPEYETVMRNANQGPEQGTRQNSAPRMDAGSWHGIWSLPATLGPEPRSAYTSFAVHEESTINHEYAHQVQQRQFKDEFIGERWSGMAVGVPCFLMEGTARIPELVLIFDTAEEFEPSDARTGAYLYDPESADELGNFTVTMNLSEEVTVEFAEDYLRTSQEPQCQAGYQYALGYHLGYIATQGLAAIGGVESTMNLFTRIGYNDIPFEEAFEGIYGITWEEAVPILAALISKEYLS